ncbi:hypothetical protein FDECE_11847 [Fusarium decemcellulare]|nr:hypothetical protein FDECE_11847 [Fusarium decemcellulare]
MINSIAASPPAGSEAPIGVGQRLDETFNRIASTLYDHSIKLEELQQEAAAMRCEASQITKDHEKLEKRMELKCNHDEIESGLADLRSKFGDLKSKHDVLRSDVEELRTNYDNLRSRMDEQEDTLIDVQNNHQLDSEAQAVINEGHNQRITGLARLLCGYLIEVGRVSEEEMASVLDYLNLNTPNADAN